MAKLEGNLKAEVDAQIRGLAGVFATALDGVLSETLDRLKSHIKSDVYDQWTPTEYERRGEEGGIIDLDTHLWPHHPSILAGVENNTPIARFDFNYRPTGESEQWRIPAYGDALIGRIENGTGYEWKTHPGARPFWHNFVSEMIDENGFGEAAYRELRMLGVEIEGFPQTERSASGNGEY